MGLRPTILEEVVPESRFSYEVFHSLISSKDLVCQRPQASAAHGSELGIKQ